MTPVTAALNFFFSLAVSVSGAQTNLKESRVSIEAARVEDAVLPLVKLCELLLQVFVYVLRTRVNSLTRRVL